MTYIENLLPSTMSTDSTVSVTSKGGEGEIVVSSVCCGEVSAPSLVLHPSSIVITIAAIKPMSTDL